MYILYFPFLIGEVLINMPMVIFIIVSFTSVIVISQKFYPMPTDGLRAPDTRHVYLITYSKVDKSKFPSRQDFAEDFTSRFC